MEFQLQHHSFQRNPRADLLQNGLVGSPCSPRDSQESSPTPHSKASILRRSAFFTVQLSHPYMTTGKTIALTAAAAKSLQSCLTVRPHRWQPTRLPRPWDFPGKNSGVGCHFLLQCMKVKSEREVAQSYPTHSDPMDCSLPGSSVHGIFQAGVLEWGAIAFSVALTRQIFIGKVH